MTCYRILGMLTPLLLLPGAVAAERSAADWTASVASEYSRFGDLTYLEASNVDLQLDVYAPRGVTAPNPVVVYYHGGGWGGGKRESAFLNLLPYLEMGFSVVNVEYRGARIALAPAAVEDCRCALRWVVANAEKYKFDTSKIVLTGDSAGSHLALMSGMLTPEAGLDRMCAGSPEPAVAAIVNWCGATDVNDLLTGANQQGFAVNWLGDQPDRAAIARLVSPLTYVRPGLPAILSIHGDADRVVPIAQATRLHAELDKVAVVNRLVTIPGGGHGGFSRAQNEETWAVIRTFLAERRVLPASR